MKNIEPTDIQRKHREEREAVIIDALQSSRHHLAIADKHFVSVIRDRGTQDEFVQSLERAHKILVDLGIEPVAS